MSLEKRASPPLRTSSCSHTIVKAWGVFLNNDESNLEEEKYSVNSISNILHNKRYADGRQEDRHIQKSRKSRSNLHPFLITRRNEPLPSEHHRHGKRKHSIHEMLFREQTSKEQMQEEMLRRRRRRRRRSSGIDSIQHQQPSAYYKRSQSAPLIWQHGKSYEYTPTNNHDHFVSHNPWHYRYVHTKGQHAIIDNKYDTTHNDESKEESLCKMDDFTPVTESSIQHYSTLLSEATPEKIAHRKEQEEQQYNEKNERVRRKESSIRERSLALTAPSSTSSSSSSPSHNDNTYISTNPQVSPITTADNTMIVNDHSTTEIAENINEHLRTISPDNNNNEDSKKNVHTVFDDYYEQEHHRQEEMRHEHENERSVYPNQSIHHNSNSNIDVQKYNTRTISPAMSDFLFGITAEQTRANSQRHNTTTPESILSLPHSNPQQYYHYYEEEEEEYGKDAPNSLSNWQIPSLSPRNFMNVGNDNNYAITDTCNWFGTGTKMKRKMSITSNSATIMTQRIYRNKNPYQHVKSIIHQYRNNRYNQLQATFASARQQHIHGQHQTSLHSRNKHTRNNNYRKSKLTIDALRSSNNNKHTTPSLSLPPPPLVSSKQKQYENWPDQRSPIKVMVMHSFESFNSHSPEARNPHCVRHFSLPEHHTLEWLTRHNNTKARHRNVNKTKLKKPKKQRRSASVPVARHVHQHDFHESSSSTPSSSSSSSSEESIINNDKLYYNNRSNKKHKTCLQDKVHHHFGQKTSLKDMQKKTIWTNKIYDNAEVNSSKSKGKKTENKKMKTANNKTGNATRERLARRATVPLVPHCAYVIPQRYLPETPKHFTTFTRTKSCHLYTPRPNGVARAPQTAREMPLWARQRNQKQSMYNDANNKNSDDESDVIDKMVESNKRQSITPMHKIDEQYKRIHTQPFVTRASQSHDRVIAHSPRYRVTSLSSVMSSSSSSSTPNASSTESIEQIPNREQNRKHELEEEQEEEARQSRNGASDYDEESKSLPIKNENITTKGKDDYAMQNNVKYFSHEDKSKKKKKNKKKQTHTEQEMRERHTRLSVVRAHKGRFIPNFVLVERRVDDFHVGNNAANKEQFHIQQRQKQLEVQQHQERDKRAGESDHNTTRLIDNTSETSLSVQPAHIIMNAQHYTKSASNPHNNNYNDQIHHFQQMQVSVLTESDQLAQETSPLLCRDKLVFDIDAPTLIHTQLVH